MKSTAGRSDRLGDAEERREVEGGGEVEEGVGAWKGEDLFQVQLAILSHILPDIPRSPGWYLVK